MKSNAVEYDVANYNIAMYDKPTRKNSIKDKVIWRAETSVLGMNSNEKYVPSYRANPFVWF